MSYILAVVLHPLQCPTPRLALQPLSYIQTSNAACLLSLLSFLKLLVLRNLVTTCITVFLVLKLLLPSLRSLFVLICSETRKDLCFFNFSCKSLSSLNFSPISCSSMFESMTSRSMKCACNFYHHFNGTTSVDKVKKKKREYSCL